MNTEQEILFAKTLEQVKKLAREQENFIERTQITEAFSDLQLSDEQMSLVFEYLEKQKIGIDRKMDSEELLSESEINYLEEYRKSIACFQETAPGKIEAVTLSAMAGDDNARQELIHLYLPKVLEIARLYAGQGVFLEDLVGEGNMALTLGVTMLGCLENAAEAEGMLGKIIMDAMEDFIQENMTEEDKNKKLLLKVNKVAKKAKELSAELRRKVTVAELSAETGMTEKTIRDAMRLSGYTIEEIETVS